jgi:hypothetical protein
VVLGFLLLKAAGAVGDGAHHAAAAGERPVFVILLAQGGEFGFVVFQTALQRRRDRAQPRRCWWRGGGVDAADAAAAGAGRPLVGAAPGRLRRRGRPLAEIDEAGAAGRAGHHLPASAATARSWAGCSMPTA